MTFRERTDGDSASRSEIRFASIVLLAMGMGLVLFALGIDRMAGASETELGPLQLASLAAGTAMALVGAGLLSSTRFRRFVEKRWPGGDLPEDQSRRVLGFALWIGAWTALLDLGLRFVQDILGQRWSSLNPHAGWMTPLSYAVVMLGIAGILALFAKRGWSRLGSHRLAVFLLLLVAIASPLSVYESELHWLSIGLLSLGIAARSSAPLASRADSLHRIVRSTTRPLVFAVAFVGVLPFAWREVTEWRGFAMMPETRSRGPNVLLIVLDTVRAQNLSLYGYVRETTPGLERIARSAVVYDRAIAPTSWTLPSHATMFTGFPPHLQSSNYGKPLDDDLPTLAEVLRDRGWYTLGVVANLDNAFPHTGLDRGFMRYDAGIASSNELLLASSAGRIAKWVLERFGRNSLGPTRKNAAVVNARFLDLVERRRDRPFYAFLNYYDAHFPFDHPLPPDTLISSWTRPEIPLQFEQLMARIDEYDREIAFIDHQIEHLLDLLERKGILANTVVVITSDHGEEFSEHGRTGHGWNVYDTSLHVPLIVLYPRLLPQGIRVTRPVGLQDIPATVMMLTGQRDRLFPGSSLVTMGSDTSSPSPVLSELSGSPETPLDEIGGWDQRSLVSGRLHYLRKSDGSEELYDVEADPWEARDLAGLPEGIITLPHFRAHLAALTSSDRRVDASGRDRRLTTVAGREPEGKR